MLRAGLHIGDCHGANTFEAPLVEVRAAPEHLAARQDVGLSTESTDALHAPHEARQVLCLDALQLTRRRSDAQKALELFVDGRLDVGEFTPWLGGSLDDEQAADLHGVEVGSDTGGDLIVVDESLVETGRLAQG